MTKINTFIYIGISLIGYISNAQINITQPEGAIQLLQVKNKVDNSFSIYKNYSIQVFQSSNSDEAKKIYSDLRNSYNNIETTILKQNNYYKVLIGNFKNKIEAYKLYLEIKNKYNKSYMVLLGPSR